MPWLFVLYVYELIKYFKVAVNGMFNWFIIFSYLVFQLELKLT